MGPHKANHQHQRAGRQRAIIIGVGEEILNEAQGAVQRVLVMPVDRSLADAGALDLLRLRPFMLSRHREIAHGFKIAPLDEVMPDVHPAADAARPALHLVGTVVVQFPASHGGVAILRQPPGEGHVPGAQVLAKDFAAAGPRQLTSRHTLPRGNADWRRRVGVIEDDAGPSQLIKRRRTHDGIARVSGDIGAMLIAH